MPFSASADIDLFDPEAVRALLAAQARELALKDQQLAEKDAELARKDAEIAARDERLSSGEEQIEHLKLVIEKLRRDAFGAKSEKLDRNVDQLELKLEELESDQAADEVAARIDPNKPIKNKPVRTAAATKPIVHPALVRLAALSPSPKRTVSAAQKPVLLTHHPLVIVNASAQRSVVDSIRRALARRNWTIAPARIAVPRREAQTTLFYARDDYAVAKALARTLALPIHFVPNACHCVGLRLVIGTNALNRRYSELESRTPLQVGALSTALFGSKWQGSQPW